MIYDFNYIWFMIIYISYEHNNKKKNIFTIKKTFYTKIKFRQFSHPHFFFLNKITSLQSFSDFFCFFSSIFSNSFYCYGLLSRSFMTLPFYIVLLL